MKKNASEAQIKTSQKHGRVVQKSFLGGSQRWEKKISRSLTRTKLQPAKYGGGKETL